MNALQKGMSMSQMMGLLVLIGLAAIIVINMVPAYIDNSSVARNVESVKEHFAGTSVREITDSEINRRLTANFQVNMVDDAIAKSVKIKREKGKVMLIVNYEIRKPLMGNVDVVMKFTNEAEIGY